MKIDPDKVKVAELMQTNVVKLAMNLPIEKASETFDDYGISGAPVVDESGNLQGVLSASDLIAMERLEGDTVSYRMTPTVLTVTPDATLGEVCDLMNRETVHRVFVTEGQQLLGVVSASDVVAYAAKSSSAWTGDRADRG